MRSYDRNSSESGNGGTNWVKIAKWGLPPFFLLALFFSGCMGCQRISPGSVGIVVNYYGSQRGVADYTLRTGMVFYNPVSETVLEYPTFVQTTVWTANSNEGSAANEEITFNSSEGMSFAADISLSYQLVAAQVPAFYVKFRSDDLSTFTMGYLHNVARDAFNEIGATYTVEEIYSTKKAELLKRVEDKVNAQVNPFGVQVIQFGFIGTPRPPAAVLNALNMKVAAIQKAQQVQNEIMSAQFEAQKTVATADGQAKARIAIAEGEAKANQVLAQSITPQLLEWRRLDIAQQTIAKWNGVRPMVEGSGANMLFSLPLPQK